MDDHAKGDFSKESSQKKYIIGIDLGTTHSVLSYCERERGAAPAPIHIQIQKIPQWISPSQIAERPILPSFLYLPLPGEMAQDPFKDDAPWVIGEYARTRAGEVLGRSIASSKSWLCHPGVERNAPILPWGAASDDSNEADSVKFTKISPVQAAARILKHLKNAWNQSHPQHPLEHQEIILTVPASFDEAARELTLLAAEEAGFLAVRLLEEPQAAFYDYMRNTGEQGLNNLCPQGQSAQVLVCDIGGGTMDLSLIQIDRIDTTNTKNTDTKSTKITRIAVGRHLLLGGDNMDLALAHACEQKLFPQNQDTDAPKRLGTARFAQLVNACRNAKEKLLGENEEGSDENTQIPITLLGSGANILKGALKTNLSKKEAQDIILEGFFPHVPKDAKAQKTRSGLLALAFGLPYERDSAMTRHIAEFISKNSPGSKPPNALLLNGGVFLAPTIRKRLKTMLSEWAGTSIQILPNPDPELAVARGAAAFALSLQGQGFSIESGAAHGFYVGLKSGDKNAEKQAVCVIPKGAKEGVTHIAANRAFALALGTQVRFELYASNDATIHAPGQIVTLNEEQFHALPPLVTALSPPAPGDKNKAKSGQEVKVALSGELTAVGTLELACIEIGVQEPRRFRLAFQLKRDEEGEVPEASKIENKKPGRGRALEEAKEAIQKVFSKDQSEIAPREVKDLSRKLERILGNRSDWTIETARTLFDTLWIYPKSRRRTAEHERVFWQLSGFCLRPGFGDAQDGPRAQAFGALFSERLAFAEESRNWQHFWIAFRRIAGGLPENTQELIRDTLDPFFAPPEKKYKKPKNIKNEAYFDMLELMSSLERVPAPRRAELGAWILERTWTQRDDRFWAALGRIGARVPAYASAHHVVSPLVVEKWLDHLLREKWEEYPSAAGAAMRMARVTGDRARDISERIRKDVAARLTQVGAREDWIKAVKEYVAVEQEERAAFFGDSLPVGLRLLEITAPSAQ